MKVWKKNVTAAAVLVTVCAGIYLNWMYTEGSAPMSLSDTLNSEKILNDDLLVMSQDEALQAAAEDYQDTASDYFAAVRLSRQEARDSAVNLLQEAMAYGDGNNGENTAQMESIIEMALCEATIESLVIAKGYTDCVAYMGNDGISVAVASPEGGLKKDDVAVIADIVMNQSQYTLDEIRVVEVQ